ncbi:MAG: hypothetical protein ACRDT2_08900 [Natronosporangium sp.]
MTGLANLRRVMAYAAIVGTLALVAACGSGGGDSEVPAGPTQGTAAAPAATVDPQHLPILTAFEAFVAAASQAASEADPDHPGLADTADEQALITTQRDIQQAADQGRRYLGQIRVAAAEVTMLDLDASAPLPNATVVACWDISGYVLVDAGQSPVPVQRTSERFTVSAQLRHLPDDGGRWIVVTIASDMEVPC